MHCIRCIKLQQLISKTFKITSYDLCKVNRPNTRDYTLLTNYKRSQKWKPLISTQIKLSDIKNKEEGNVLKVNKDKQVYFGSLTPQIRAVKIFSLSTSFLGITIQPVLYNQISHISSVPVIIALSSVVGFFTLVTPFLIHLVTKKYITQISYNEQEKVYTATLLTFFLKDKIVKFTPNDVEVPDIPGMFTSFLVKGKPVFVDPRSFHDIEHYSIIMGYDKPIDYKLTQDQPNDTKTN